MKNLSKVQTRIDGKLDLFVYVKCPYCGKFTSISRVMSSSECPHFEDYTLFKEEKSSFSEIESPDERVMMVESTFRRDGSRNLILTINRTGEVVESEEGFNLITDGKFESFLKMGDLSEIFQDYREEDGEYIKGD
jgi:hypothetical protein